MITIYVHHYYTELLFQKFFHNVKNKKIFEISNTYGAIKEITFSYHNVDFKVIFNPELNDNDGIHIIDYFGILKQRGQRGILLENIPTVGSESLSVFNGICNLIRDKKDWIISVFRTEKLFILNDNWKIRTGGTEQIAESEKLLLELSNHQILTDNVFIDESVKNKYPNIHHPFTNIIFQWNELISIRWFYDYKNISDAINPKYKLGYSVRRHKPYRIKLAKTLSKIKDVFVSQTNSINEPHSMTYYEKIDNIYFNDIDSEIDFQNIRSVNNLAIGFDFFLRILPMYKIQICDESWSDNVSDFTSQYLSEKTIGLVLANVPFICTHSYPYDCLSKLMNAPKHPFYDESKKYQGNVDLFVEFVELFLSDFDKNYKLCKDWVLECHNIFMDRIHNENSMLDMITMGKIKSREPINYNLI